MAKEGLIARLFMLGVVQTADGLPIYHEVFAGNAAETTTLLPTLTTVLERFPEVRRLILVADRGLLSLDNLEALEAVRLASGEPLEFIIAVPGRRHHEFAELLDPFQRAHCAQATAEVTGELAWQGRRLIVAHNPATAAQQTAQRNAQIRACTSWPSAARVGLMVGRRPSPKPPAATRMSMPSTTGGSWRAPRSAAMTLITPSTPPTSPAPTVLVLA
jgi:hypothetical protein